jgi:hypothetical protein
MNGWGKSAAGTICHLLDWSAVCGSEEDRLPESATLEFLLAYPERVDIVRRRLAPLRKSAPAPIAVRCLGSDFHATSAHLASSTGLVGFFSVKHGHNLAPMGIL